MDNTKINHLIDFLGEKSWEKVENKKEVKQFLFLHDQFSCFDIEEYCENKRSVIKALYDSCSSIENKILLSLDEENYKETLFKKLSEKSKISFWDYLLIKEHNGMKRLLQK